MKLYRILDPLVCGGAAFVGYQAYDWIGALICCVAVGVYGCILFIEGSKL